MVKCNDKNCPFHGKINVRKRKLTGVVDSTRMRRTVNVKREHRVLLPKYERYTKHYSSIKAHNPECVSAQDGDVVTIAECRPISKSKRFVVVAKKHTED